MNKDKTTSMKGKIATREVAMCVTRGIDEKETIMVNGVFKRKVEDSKR